MSIRIKCECGKTYTIDERYGGRKALCKACGSVIKVPTRSDLELSTDLSASKERGKRRIEKTDSSIGDEIPRSKSPPDETPVKKSFSPVWITVAVLNVCIISVALFVAQVFRSKHANNASESADVKSASKDNPAWGISPSGLLAVKPLTTEEIVENTESSVARVVGINTTGTGFVVGNKLVITNAHVVNMDISDNINVYFPSNPYRTKGPYPTSLLYKDNEADIAVLACDTPSPQLAIDSAYSFKKGEDVIIIGSPTVGTDTILENAVTRGIMSTATVINGNRMYQLGASVNPGNSGGPVVDSKGKVIGMISSRAADEESLSFCIPASALVNAITTVKNLTKSQKEAVVRNHRIEVAYNLLNKSTFIYIKVLEHYGYAMIESLQAGYGELAGLNAARSDPSVKTMTEAVAVTAKRMREMTHSITQDESIPEDIRTNFRELFDVFIEARSYVENARGNAAFFRAKAQVLGDRYERFSQPLSLLIDPSH